MKLHLGPPAILEVAVLHLPDGRIEVAHEFVVKASRCEFAVYDNGAMFAHTMQPESDSGNLWRKA